MLCPEKAGIAGVMYAWQEKDKVPEVPKATSRHLGFAVCVKGTFREV